MKTTKEKQFIIIELDDGSVVKYNMETNETIGKRGKPVKTLNSQLKDIDLWEFKNSIVEENFLKLFEFTEKYYDLCTTPSGIISKLKYFSHLEVYFNIGLDVNYPIPTEDDKLNRTFIPLIKKYDVKINSTLIKNLNDSNLINSIFHNDYIDADYFKYWVLKAFSALSGYRLEPLNILINNFNYNTTNLFKYIEKLRLLEGIESFADIIRELLDYNQMMSTLAISKYDKYPRHFLSTFHIVQRNFNRFKTEFSEELFAKRIDTTLETNIKEFTFICPKTTSDVKQEGVQQNNCVASYIDRILNGTCHIVFMRNKEKPDTSLITLEISNYKVVQAKQSRNRELTDSQLEIVDKYNDYLEKLRLKSELEQAS